MTDLSANITVLIPTFNRAPFIGACLESVFGQTLTPRQVIVVNDGSTDGTREALESWMPRIHYLESPQVGKASALNEGLKKVTGGYLWIFDDDDVALPDALERFAGPLERDKAYDFSFSPYYLTPTVMGGNALGAPMAIYEQPDLEKRGPLIPILESNYLGGAALFVRTSCYGKVGPFVERLVRSQDYEMAIRIVRRFRGVRILGGPTFHYRQHTGDRGSQFDRFKERLRMKKWLQYDQIFFRDLYRNIPLEEYLLPGRSLSVDHRLALLQRMAVMASKHLVPEMLQDLAALSARHDAAPPTLEEKELIKKIGTRSIYSRQHVLGDGVFLAKLSALAKKSSFLRSFRAELQASILKEFIWRPHPSLLAAALRSI